MSNQTRLIKTGGLILVCISQRSWEKELPAMWTQWWGQFDQWEGAGIMRRHSWCGESTAAQLHTITANYSKKQKLYIVINKSLLCLSVTTNMETLYSPEERKWNIPTSNQNNFTNRNIYVSMNYFDFSLLRTILSVNLHLPVAHVYCSTSCIYNVFCLALCISKGNKCKVTEK